MDFAFFENLGNEDANTFLKTYRQRESEAMPQFLEHVTNAGGSPDYSITTLPMVIQSTIGKLATIPRKDDPSLPEFIRNTPIHQATLFDFDEKSSIDVLRLSYYLGETFCRNYQHLRWSTGDPNYAQANMPVITGFQHELELATMFVTENICCLIVSDPDDTKSIPTMIDYWTNAAV